jgi:hypothetical protein
MSREHSGQMRPLPTTLCTHVMIVTSSDSSSSRAPVARLKAPLAAATARAVGLKVAIAYKYYIMKMHLHSVFALAASLHTLILFLSEGIPSNPLKGTPPTIPPTPVPFILVLSKSLLLSCC